MMETSKHLVAAALSDLVTTMAKPLFVYRASIKYPLTEDDAQRAVDMFKDGTPDMVLPRSGDRIDAVSPSIPVTDRTFDACVSSLASYLTSEIAETKSSREDES